MIALPQARITPGCGTLEGLAESRLGVPLDYIDIGGYLSVAGNVTAAADVLQGLKDDHLH
jgi:hypothetical protein